MSLDPLNTIAAVALFLTGTQAVAISPATTKQAAISGYRGHW